MTTEATLSEAETNADAAGEYVIECFNAGPLVRLNGIAAWLSRLEGEGYELVTAYGVPHPTGNMVMHYYVLRKRAAPSTSVLISEEQGRKLLETLAGEQLTGKLEPVPPTTGSGVKPAEPSRGRRR